VLFSVEGTRLLRLLGSCLDDYRSAIYHGDRASWVDEVFILSRLCMKVSLQRSFMGLGQLYVDVAFNFLANPSTTEQHLKEQSIIN
jgi:hypothetical protein